MNDPLQLLPNIVLAEPPHGKQPLSSNGGAIDISSDAAADEEGYGDTELQRALELSRLSLNGRTSAFYTDQNIVVGKLVIGGIVLFVS